MAHCVDEVILVGIKVTNRIQKGLMEEGFDENHLHICKDFAQAMKVLKKSYRSMMWYCWKMTCQMRFHINQISIGAYTSVKAERKII